MVELAVWDAYYMVSSQATRTKMTGAELADTGPKCTRHNRTRHQHGAIRFLIRFSRVTMQYIPHTSRLHSGEKSS